MIVVGDSLSVGTAPYVHARTYARKGRALAEGAAVIRGLPHVHVLVVGLGSNDSTLTDPLPVIRLARRRADCVVWLTVRRRGSNFTAFNARLPAPKVHWARAVRRRPGLLEPDGLHATVRGYRVRARMIERTVARAC